MCLFPITDMYEFFKLRKTFEDQEVTLLISNYPQHEGMRVTRSGHVMDLKGKLSWCSIFPSGCQLSCFFGIVGIENDQLDYLVIDPMRVTRSDFYPAFMELKQNAMEITERQLEIILKVTQNRTK